MERRKVLHAFSAAVLLFFVIIPGTNAGDSEMESLRKEVRELNKTVKKLTGLVSQQNKRIEELERKRAVSQPENFPAKETPPVSAEADSPKTVQAAMVEEQKSEQATTPESSQSDDEVNSLMNKLNNAPPTPGSNTSNLAGWRVRTGGSTAAKLIPDISVVGTFAGAYYTQDPMGDVLPSPDKTGFTFQELELAFQGAVDPYFRYDAFLSFNLDGVEVEEAYFTTLGGLPRGLQFRGGRFYLPFGRQNQKHLHTWSFADQNLVNQTLLGPDNDSELGLEASYLFPAPFFLQLQGTFTNGSNDTSWGGMQKQDFLYQGRLSGSGDLSDEVTVLMGASYAYGFNDTGPGNNTQLLGGDFLIKWKPSAYRSLTWQTEYIARWYQVPGATDVDGGLYSYIDFQFFKRWIFGLRYDQTGIPIGLVAREFRLTPALTFRPTEFSQIRLQYEFDKISQEPSQQAVILQFMFSLGVHGPHKF